MNFSSTHNYLIDGEDWRGIRTKTHSYTRYLDDRIYLFDLKKDPLQMDNLAGVPKYENLQNKIEKILQSKMEELGDEFLPCTMYANWFDEQRRVIRNAKGVLSNPERRFCFIK